MYQGHSIHVTLLGDDVAELCFNRRGDVINKLDELTFRELREATAVITATPAVRGALITSAKEGFIVGGDITEFVTTFKLEQAALAAHTAHANEVFVALEDLPIPTLAVINGFALGGGLELALAAQLRVMSSTAQIGLPEVKLGLFPGAGGTVRLPRVAGLVVAADWIISGSPQDAEAALRAGVVDAISPPQTLRSIAISMLKQAMVGEVDWRSKRARKLVPISMDASKAVALFSECKIKAIASSGKHQPARLAVVELMESTVHLDRAGALEAESEAFARIAKTQAAGSLVRTFLNEQALKKAFKKHTAGARPVRQAAVVGAGIMGGGIAYASALAGIPVRMKDISPRQLELGIQEARKQLARMVQRGRKTRLQADAVIAAITPQLDNAGFGSVEIVIEAVVENLKFKHAVLAELELHVTPDAIIASNTSSLRIDHIAERLSRPQNFVGMHFFNPVPLMSLVEVIKGTKTSDVAVSTAVGYGVAMGKIPIVVKDCPGFLINRILTSYTRAFLEIVVDGADFVQVDRALEAFGWPMGPAYLQDVVGMDTGAHVLHVISAGYSDRMPQLTHNALQLMVENKRFGQKSGIGFYRYDADPHGKPKKRVADDSHALLAAVQPRGRREFSDTEMVERLMLPLVLEAIRALEDGAVATPAELDMALLLSIGFPPYLGGALRYADWLGLSQIVALSEKYSDLGASYRATDRMRQMAATDQAYYD